MPRRTMPVHTGPFGRRLEYYVVALQGQSDFENRNLKGLHSLHGLLYRMASECF